MAGGKRFRPEEETGIQPEETGGQPSEQEEKTPSAKPRRRAARREKKRPPVTGAPTWMYRILAILLVCVLGLLVFFTVRSCSLEEVDQWVEQNTRGTGIGDGYPTNIVGSSIQPKNFLTINRELVMASDTALVRLNSTAKQLINIQHSYDNPILKVAGEQMLVYSLGSQGYTIETKERTLIKSEMENSIMAGDVAANGRYALVTDGNGYPSALTVFMENHTVQYEYRFSGCYVSDIALNPDGTGAAVSGIWAKDGALVSLIYLLDFSREEPVAVLECSENLILDVFYSQDGAVFAVGDTGVSVIQSGDASKVDYTFDGYSLAGYSLYGNRAALALQAYDTGGTGKLVVLDNTGSIFAELSTGDNITGISLFGDTLAVLTDGQVKGYSVNALRNRDTTVSGTEAPFGTLDAGSDARAIALSDESTVYVLGISQIRSLHF